MPGDDVIRLANRGMVAFDLLLGSATIAAPDATLLVVTDPPDPLTDIAREAAGHDRVFGTGTLIDSLRLRVHIAQWLRVDPGCVDAMVLGEHGKSSVTLWSSATVAGVPVTELLADGDRPVADVQAEIEEEVSNANITIIEGIGASQYGIGIVCARLAETVLRDEGCVFPVGSYRQQYGVTLSLPTVIGRHGVLRTLPPKMSQEERDGLERSALVLREALEGARRRDG